MFSVTQPTTDKSRWNIVSLFVYIGLQVWSVTFSLVCSYLFLPSLWGQESCHPWVEVKVISCLTLASQQVCYKEICYVYRSGMLLVDYISSLSGLWKLRVTHEDLKSVTKRSLKVLNSEHFDTTSKFKSMVCGDAFGPDKNLEIWSMLVRSIVCHHLPQIVVKSANFCT